MGLPRVRVVVVNWNGRDDTLRCLDSLDDLDWPREALEVVVVDNGSTDGLVPLLRRQRPHVRVVEAGRNLGFAAGCNAGMRDLDAVEFVALLNNDAAAEPRWLRALVNRAGEDDAIGAVTSCVLFASPFAKLVLTSDASSLGPLDGRRVGFRLHGVRADGEAVRAQRGSGWWGLEHGPCGDHAWSDGSGVLWVPVTGAGPWDVELLLAAPARRNVDVGGTTLKVGARPAWHRVQVTGPAVRLIDNAGSVLLADGYGADRHHLEVAAGAEATDVFAWYGGAVLLRTAYLRDVGLFDERLFMYYEDLELSWRGRRRGWRTVYEPAAVVHHVHSASSVEGSRFAQHHGERNRLVVLTRHAAPGTAVRAVVRFLASTASYARRDVAAPPLRRERPRPETVRRRLRAFGGYLGLVPYALRTRGGRGLVPVSRRARGGPLRR